MNPQVIHALTGVLAVLLGGIFIIIPAAGLTIRYAFRPLIQAWIELKERQLTGGATEVLERRVSILELELQQMQHAMQSLTDAADFERRLEEGRGPNRVAPPRASHANRGHSTGAFDPARSSLRCANRSCTNTAASAP